MVNKIILLFFILLLIVGCSQKKEGKFKNYFVDNGDTFRIKNSSNCLVWQDSMLIGYPPFSVHDTVYIDTCRTHGTVVPFNKFNGFTGVITMPTTTPTLTFDSTLFHPRKYILKTKSEYQKLMNKGIIHELDTIKIGKEDEFIILSING